VRLPGGRQGSPAERALRRDRNAPKMRALLHPRPFVPAVVLKASRFFCGCFTHDHFLLRRYAVQSLIMVKVSDLITLLLGKRQPDSFNILIQLRKKPVIESTPIAKSHP